MGDLLFYNLKDTGGRRKEKKNYYQDLPMTPSDAESLPEAEWTILVQEWEK